MWEEDGQIIYKCLNGEPEAFGFLIDKYKESVYYFAYTKLLNFHDAEDVMQEVFIKAYKNLRSLRRWDSFHTWLYSIASNHCKMWLRSKSRRPDKDYIEDEAQEILEIPSIESYSENLASESINESLQEALSSLPEIYRQVLVLYYPNGMNSHVGRHSLW
jgi:RNA polymerase sigma-70 factor (ECF subfamily)